MDYLEIEHSDLKDFIRININEVCNSYVEIGWYLNLVNKRGLYTEDGYKGIGDYATAEYGISKDRCSWLMKVAEKFCGNDAPGLLPEYKAFTISKLREMVYLEDGQIAEIKPEATVKEIRQMKPKQEAVKPKRIEEQIDINQFPEYLPLQETVELGQASCSHEHITCNRNILTCCKNHRYCCADCNARCNAYCGWVKDNGWNIVHDSVIETDENINGEFETADIVATPQLKTEPEEYVDNYRGEFEDPNKIHKRRAINILVRLLVNSNIDWFREDYTNRVMHVDRSEKQIKERFLNEKYKIKDEMYKEIFLEPDSIKLITEQGLIHKADWFYLCASTLSQWNDIVHDYWKQESGKIEAENQENQEHEDTANGELDNSLDDNLDDELDNNPDDELDDGFDEKYLAKELLRIQEQYLKDIESAYADDSLHSRKLVKKKKIEVEALKLYLAALKADDEPEPAEQIQPELPAMKNNDQRKDFLETYENWPIWIDNKDTEERYYRYDLPDEYSIVIKVYFSKSYWKKEEAWGSKETYLLKQGMHFKDSETSMTAVIEHLKNMQKKKGGI